MPRWLVRIGTGVAALLLLLGFVGWQWGGPILFWYMRPSIAFEADLPAPPPDYTRPESWAALPDRRDGADVVPLDSGAEDRQADARADVFFLHPTTYYSSAHWNGPIDDALVRRVTDGAILPQQASAFNGAARVFAPRYRQLTLGGYSVDGEREKGLELAYGDVRRAFEHYLATWNDGRPIIIAGHSQGSGHAQRLLDDFFEGKPLGDRLVAAYIIGASVWDGRYVRGETGIPRCESASQTHCLVSWRSFAEGGKDEKFGKPPQAGETTVCTNPLSWTIGGERVDRARNLGSIPLVRGGELAALDRQMVGARCADGALWIDEPERPGYSFALFPGKNYHTYDYNLFYMNLRANAECRVAAYFGEACAE